MLYKTSIVLKLFRNSFFLMVTILFITLLLVAFISITNSAYKLELDKKFSTKQPHIKITFISGEHSLEEKEIEELEKKIINYAPSKIKNISAYSEGNRFFSFSGAGFLSKIDAGVQIKIIGIERKQNLPYNFFRSFFLKRAPFQIPYTPIEFIYRWIDDSRISIFNNSLLNSFYPPVVTETVFEMKSDKVDSRIVLLGAFNDFKDTPTLYTSIIKANELLNNAANHIDGFLLNLEDMKDLSSVKNILDEKLNDSYPGFVVKSWLEEHLKESTIFNVFNKMTQVISFIILLLSIIVLLLVQYRSIVVKNYQLNIFYYLGINLKTTLFLAVTLITFFSVICAGVVIFYTLPQLMAQFGIYIQHEQIYEIFLRFFSILTIYLYASYLTISSAFKLNLTKEVDTQNLVSVQK